MTQRTPVTRSAGAAGQRLALSSAPVAAAWLCHNRRVALPEDDPLSDIEAFFAQNHFQVELHKEAPPEPTPDERRKMSSSERQARKSSRPPYWADLKRVDTGELVRWYGGGDTPEAAMRSARSRWRVEEGD